MLQAQNRVGEQAAHQAEQQHGERVLLPIVFLVRIHSHHAIGEPLQRPQHRVEPGFAIRIEHLHQIKPHRLGDQHERDDVEGKLNPARSLHMAILRIFPAESWPRTGR